MPRPVRVFAIVGGAPPPPVAGAPALPDKPSVAVLPFVNMSPEAEQEYFADGLSEDIITALAAAPGLFVIARNSSFSYKGAAVDVRRVGRDLGVRYLLEGSVRKAGARLRVTGQLVDAESGAHLWAEHMDGQIEDVFALQDRITEAVVAAIAPAIQGAEIARATAKRPDSLTAYDHILRAMAALNRAQVPAAIEQLDRALAIAPAYGRALALRAWCNTIRPTWSGEVESDTDRVEAIALARRALEAAPGDSEVAAYSGYTLGFSGDDTANAMSLVRGAVERCPSFGWAWVSIGMLEALFGDPRRALDACDRAERLNPRDPMAFRLHSARVVAHWALLDWESVLEHGLRTLAASPRISYVRALLVVGNAELGRHDAARAAAAILREQFPDFSIENHAERVDRMPGVRGAPVAAWRRRLREAGLPP